MTQYIDKSALIAEIERLITELVEEGEGTMFEQGRISAFEDVKVFVNHALEVKDVQEEPVSEDLEEASDNYVGHAPEIDEDLSCFTKRNAFIAGAQWQEEQCQKTIELAEDHAYLAGQEKIIDKACEWIGNNFHNYANNALGKEYLVNDFKNYMKGE